jgi:UDP-2-acetamido-3-amino-2,3-dideoxy-glucuronate N-acetyltransferase
MIHETAIVDVDLSSIGEGTKVWAFVHICKNATIGKNCVIGEGVYIGPNVKIKNNVKIQNHALIYEGVEIEDDVFIGPNVITTNDIFPRSLGNWTKRFRKTLIKKGASVSANTTIICGNILNENCMIGAGSVVTKNIKANYLAYGNPAVHIKKI